MSDVPAWTSWARFRETLEAEQYALRVIAFHQLIDQVEGPYAEPLSERCMVSICGGPKGPGATEVRACAEILRLREQVRRLEQKIYVLEATRR